MRGLVSPETVVAYFLPTFYKSEGANCSCEVKFLKIYSWCYAVKGGHGKFQNKCVAFINMGFSTLRFDTYVLRNNVTRTEQFGSSAEKLLNTKRELIDHRNICAQRTAYGYADRKCSVN